MNARDFSRSIAMKLFLLRLAVAVGLFVMVLGAGAEETPVPADVLKSCKNEVGARYQNIPMAYISVDQGAKTANGNYLVNWTTKPPGGKGSVGICVVDPSFYILRFEATSGPQPGGELKVTPEAALRTCKNEVADRLRSVPMEHITVERANDAADGSYVIEWKEQLRGGGVGRSGSCTIASDGKVSKFRFDTAPAKSPGSARPSGPAH
jgi:hypothetical protein